MRQDRLRFQSLGIPRGKDHEYWLADPTADLINPLTKHKNILITGKNGVGKTYLAAALAKRRSALWIRGEDISSRSPLDFPSFWYDKTEVVIDDLFRGKLTPVGIASLISLVAQREEQDKNTIITTDKSKEDIQRIDSALASRLERFWHVNLRGKDRRKI